jgi:O-antigen ligase
MNYLPYRRGEPRDALGAAVAGVLAACLALSIGLYPGLLGPLVVVLTLLLVLLTRKSPDWLLVAALVCVFMLPLAAIDLPGILGKFITPSVVLLGAWSVRLLLLNSGARGRASVVGITAIALGAAWAASAYGSVDKLLSIRWIAVSALAVVIPGVVARRRGPGQRTWIRLEVAFAVMGIVIGLAAVSELLFRWNPWYLVYSSETLARHWSTFRAKGTTGHPLSMMAAASTCFAVTVYSRQRTRILFLMSSCLSLAAVVLSVSRTGMYALLGAVLAGTVISFFNGRRKQRAKALFAAILTGSLALAVAASPLLGERSISAEGAQSAAVRDSVLEHSLHMVQQRPLFGWGPGAGTDLFYARTGQILENSILQLLVSSGMIGAVLFLTFLVMAVMRGVKSGMTAPAVGLIAFMIAATGYNTLDTVPAYLSVLGILLVGVFVRSPDVADSPGLLANDATFNVDRSPVRQF